MEERGSRAWNKDKMISEGYLSDYARGEKKRNEVTNSSAPEDIIEDLTAREIQIIEASSHGMRMNDIALIYDIEVETVRRYLLHIRQKLKGKTIGHAACNAIRRGIIK